MEGMGKSWGPYLQTKAILLLDFWILRRSTKLGIRLLCFAHHILEFASSRFNVFMRWVILYNAMLNERCILAHPLAILVSLDRCLHHSTREYLEPNLEVLLQWFCILSDRSLCRISEVYEWCVTMVRSFHWCLKWAILKSFHYDHAIVSWFVWTAWLITSKGEGSFWKTYWLLAMRGPNVVFIPLWTKTMQNGR